MSLKHLGLAFTLSFTLEEMQSLHARAKHLLLQRMNFSNLEDAITHAHFRLEYPDISFSKNNKGKCFTFNIVCLLIIMQNYLVFFLVAIKIYYLL